MNPSAVILGRPDTVLRLPKAGLLDPAGWSQMDSDVIAHLIQVRAQIQQSLWNKAEMRMEFAGDRLVDHAFPDFEDFVFAAVYFRQLIAGRDCLLKDAASRYCRFVDCPLRRAWIDHELGGFARVFEGEALRLPGFTARQVFDAFIYGAGLLHKIPEVGDFTRRRLLDLFDN